MNRLIYDNCETAQRLSESTGPGLYNMYEGQFNNNSKCRSAFGEFSNYGVSLYNGNIVDLESDLMGINRRASLCPKNKYTPSCDNYAVCGVNGIPCSCLEATSRNLINAQTCPSMFNRPVVVQPPPFSVRQSTSPYQQSIFDWVMSFFRN